MKKLEGILTAIACVVLLSVSATLFARDWTHPFRSTGSRVATTTTTTIPGKLTLSGDLSGAHAFAGCYTNGANVAGGPTWYTNTDFAGAIFVIYPGGVGGTYAVGEWPGGIPPGNMAASNANVLVTGGVYTAINTYVGTATVSTP